MDARCRHHHTHQVGPDRCFYGSVAEEPFTHENPAAHGNVSWTEECDRCGARRAVNSNQHFVEVSPWTSHHRGEEMK